MTVLASESQGISGNLDVLDGIFPIFAPLVVIFVVWLIISDCDRLAILLSDLRAIGRALRPVGRAIRWLFDRFSLGIAWFSVCTAVWFSFVAFLFGLNGFPVPPLECWPIPLLCFSAWAFEHLYQWECESDARYQAFQRGEL